MMDGTELIWEPLCPFFDNDYIVQIRGLDSLQFDIWFLLKYLGDILCRLLKEMTGMKSERSVCVSESGREQHQGPGNEGVRIVTLGNTSVMYCARITGFY